MPLNDCIVVDIERKYMNPDGTATSRVFKLRDKDNGQLSVDVKSLTTSEQAVGDSSLAKLKKGCSNKSSPFCFGAFVVKNERRVQPGCSGSSEKVRSINPSSTGGKSLPYIPRAGIGIAITN